MQRTSLIRWFGYSLLTLAMAGPVRAADRPDDLVVFLVRHAEKVDTSRDPQLSAAGKRRAAELANALRDAKLKHVHSSDYIRTRDTAAPIAARLGLKVQLYDSRDLPTLIKQLRKTGGRHLVVGHSSTTPNAVEMLGGEPGTPIHEPTEYDRLYIVKIDKSGASTVLMRYGTPPKEQPEE
ncbi:MAG: phosphoglycerate mutase family protein [Pirellulaceae bacterium]|jgi:phosphohistidine phosphatase SixA|nr:phosphoglycerate mutase family protein [Pirellulaceae bacterium]